MKYLPVLFSKAHENSTSHGREKSGQWPDRSDVRRNIDAPLGGLRCQAPRVFSLVELVLASSPVQLCRKQV